MNATRWLAIIAMFATNVGIVSARATESISLGLVTPTSGSVALDGQREVEGARFAVKQANAAGGINGKKISLLVEDGECKPAPSAAAAEKLITRDHVIALAGALCSSATKAVQPISERYQVPLVNAISSSPSLTNPLQPWFFRLKVHNGIEAGYFSQFIASMHLKKIAALAIDDDFGRSDVLSFTPALKKLGVHFVLVRYFKHGEVNYISLLNAAKRAGADGLFLVAEVQDGALIMKQYHQLGLNMPVLGMGSFNTPEFFKVAGTNATGIYTADVWGYGVDYPAAKAFVNLWQAAHNNAYPGLYEMSGYVELETLIKALGKTGQADGTKLKSTLETLTWDSPIGMVRFDANHQAHTLMFVTKNENWKGMVVKIYGMSR